MNPDKILKFDCGVILKKEATIVLDQVLAYEIQDLGEDEGFLLKITFRSFVKDFSMVTYEQAKQIENKLDNYFNSLLF